MAGAFSVVGSSVMDSHTSLPASNIISSVKNGSNKGELVLQRSTSVKRKQLYLRPLRSLELKSDFVDSWHDSRLISNKSSRKQRKGRRLVSELAGQYEDSFEDVKTQILNYFTFKAARTVLNQLYEMNPTQYMWFYDFVAANTPEDGKRFIRILAKEKQDLAERVMITRLHLYGKWVKKCNHDEMYKEISEQNLELMRERLTETVIWPSDDTNAEKIG